MRVTNSTIYRNMLLQLQTGNTQQAHYQKEIATGQRLHEASDDPAAMGRVLGLRSEKGDHQQFVRNIDRAEALVNVNFEDMKSLQQLTLQAEEFSIKANSVIGADGFPAYAQQVNALIEQAVAIGNTKYQGEYIHAGAATDTEPFQVNTRDAQGWITVMDPWAGSNANPEIIIAHGKKMEPRTDSTQNQEISSVINNLIALRDALVAENMTDVATARTALQANETELVKAMGDIGGDLSRLQMARNLAESRFTALEQNLSDEADADLTQSIMDLNQAQVAYEAAMQSSSRIMRTSLLDYI